MESCATRSLFWYPNDASPVQTFPPDFVVATMIAPDDCWYSALKFCAMTRYSWMGAARERVPAARVLTERPTVNAALATGKIVLQACPIDEYVYLTWPLRAVRE